MKKLLMLALCFCASVSMSDACTSVIVSGKVTPDGRPLLFKHRDTPDVNNHVVIKQGEKYRFLAVVADKDSVVRSVWQGHNEKGFAIINTAAYNLNGPKDTGDTKDGVIMRRALEICASASDFEHMLDTMLVAKHLQANSNFGVIDALGNAAYYEAGKKGYTKFDVNDPKQAPHGYLVRTNFAFTGDRSLDKGVERYAAISDFMLNAALSNNYDAEYILRKVPRLLTHGITKENLYTQEPQSEFAATIVSFEDYIPRYLSASATLIKGVTKDENPLHTISYTIIGNPLVAVAIPLVIGDKLPQIVAGQGEGNHSWLCQKGLEVRDKIFPLKKGHVTDYVDLSKLINQKGTGSIQRLEPVETEILKRFNGILPAIRDDKKDATKALSTYYDWVDKYVKESL